MRKNIKPTLIVIVILVLICAAVILWHPWAGVSAPSDSSVPNSSSSELVSSSSQTIIESSVLDSSVIVQDDNSLDESDSSVEEISDVKEDSDADSDEASENLAELEEVSDLVPEDQPDSPALNFEASGSSYDDIMINVLTCLLSQDLNGLSEYVGSQGLRLSPTGTATGYDIVLSANEVSAFFSLDSQTYGNYPGSGEPIVCTPQEYYQKYISPTGFDFSSASVLYNDTSDLAAVGSYASEPKTVSYEYAPNVMEWKRLILVYDSDDSGDVLCGIIYRDQTTD